MVIADSLFLMTHISERSLLLYCPGRTFAQAYGILTRLQVGHVCEGWVEKEDIIHGYDIQIIIRAIQNTESGPVAFIIESDTYDVVLTCQNLTGSDNGFPKIISF